MKFHKSITFYLLLTSLLFCGVAVFLQIGANRDLLQTPERQLAYEVAQRLNAKIETAHQELNQVAQHLPVDSSFFSQVLPNTTLPIFVYERGQLVFWSDHTLRPEVELHLLPNDVQTVENRFGKFLIIRQKVLPTYTLIAVVPLEQRFGITNAYLKNGLNPSVFADNAAAIQLEKSSGGIPILDKDNNYLFSLTILKPGKWQSASQLAFWLFTAALLSWLLFLISFYKRLQALGHHSLAFWAMVMGLLGTRATMLLFQFPLRMQDIDLFSPRVYASSWWSPSLGDLILNELCLLIVANLVYQIGKKLRFRPDFGKTARKQVMISFLLAIALMVIVIGWYEFYRSLFTNTLLNLDITQNIQISGERLMLYAVMVGHTVALGWLLRLILPWLPVELERSRTMLLLWGTVVAVALGYGFWRDAPSGSWIILFVAMGLLGWHQIHRRFGKKAGIYSSIFLLNILSASLGAAALYDIYAVQLREDKQRMANQLLKDRDAITEYLLAQAAVSIQKDEILNHVFRGPWVNLHFIEQKIRRYHLQNLTENYSVMVRMFDVNGESLSLQDSLANLRQYAGQWLPRAQKTTQKGQLLVHSELEPGRFTYLQEVKVPLNAFQWMTIMLELSPKLTTPNSVLPALLVEQKSTQPDAIPSGSYALWKKSRWLKTEGLFEYSQYFSPQLFDIPMLYTQGVSHAGYHHLATANSSGTVALVSTPAYGFGSWLSNFSFLFILHTFALFGILVLIILSKGELVQAITSTFSTKIQLFLNLGVLVPLVLVSLTIGSLVTNSYREDLIRGYTDQGDFIRKSLMNSTLSGSGTDAPDSLVQRVNRLAVLAQTELNVYNASGELQIASQPALFEAGVISTRLNPKAYSALKNQGLNRMLLREQAGTLPYNTLYLPLRSSPHQAPTGYLAIPFFDSEKDLNTKLIQLITTILNIFTIFFLVFVVLGYVATRALTVPLQLLTERLKRTTLTGSNEKLVYKSSDEIGLLVQEYNHMLQKLEESKQELALKEKEAAWKEMARQVAHEIKNPLTPMKLSLQYLRKAMKDGRSNLEELVDKISITMITQIDVLSDIATSFSNFTSMPDLKMEPLEVTGLLKRAADLHLNPKQHYIKLLFPEQPVTVLADENHLVRIFNNLLLNALQAVPSSKTPEVSIEVEVRDDKWVLISIRDNGAGIPEDVQPKIFLPNFSTKYTGSGIGLAVVKKGVEAFGGSIWFETEEETGTTFFLKLPVLPS